jgi:adenylate kinase
MAPMTESVVDELKSTVHKLEQRIAELEGRFSGHGGGSSTAQESVRMILMGPPGAGEGTWLHTTVGWIC